MSLPSAYSLKTSALPRYFQAMAQASIPEKFDAAFLAQLGFRFAIDRPFVDILRELGFLTSDGTPTGRYHAFHAGEKKQTLAQCIADAYQDLFSLCADAYASSADEIFEKLKALYADNKNDIMIAGIAKTFLALCQYAGLGREAGTEDEPAAALPPEPASPAGHALPPVADAPQSGPAAVFTIEVQGTRQPPDQTAFSEPAPPPAGPPAALARPLGPPEAPEAAGGPGLAAAEPEESFVLDLDDALEEQALREELAFLDDAAQASSPGQGLTRVLSAPVPAAVATPRLDVVATAMAAAASPADAWPQRKKTEKALLLAAVAPASAAPEGLVPDLAEAGPAPATELPAGPAARLLPPLPADDTPENTLAGETLLALLRDVRARATPEPDAGTPGDAAAATGPDAGDPGQARRNAGPEAGQDVPEDLLLRRIMLVLPESRDPDVYDAIFTSLKNNFL
ncbi:hypothetical protein DFW101_0458 [Solidesulfovibrio carbinoliphilus subsp. oakridgensis]|uniref:DUF5343 domain-containing protein n=1 Tax=Solidesulfovibrio carbinoliphilus subsp. oakridgensis TaxID=694327 RepID=G7QDG9_9BACT|nr:DUF5343 domain-containing protein [Solidesulfovibrio carbinoliphilus]EHJ46475.1 hypothetical protein DFW101_0458 [Solidesulfovibrio carbinoliphilus subsp. oakridgensis]